MKTVSVFLTSLAVLGMLIELVGLAIAASAIWAKWRELAASCDRFAPPWLRRLLRRPAPPVEIHTVEANFGGEVTVRAIAQRVFDESADVTVRLRVLEDAARDAELNIQKHAHATQDKLCEINRRVDDSRREINARLDGDRAGERREEVADLRQAGWGLLIAAVGLFVQIPAAVLAIVIATIGTT